MKDVSAKMESLDWTEIVKTALKPHLSSVELDALNFEDMTQTNYQSGKTTGV